MPSSDITKLLQKWGDGDKDALEQLTPLLYAKLHRMAQNYMRNERPGHTLQATALINEAYVRLIGWNHVQWQNRAQFFAVSAQLMRRILVDFARSRNYAKRGAGAPMISLEEIPEVSKKASCDIVPLDDALRALSAIDARKGQIVELRFFGGLSVDEIAEVLGVSSRTVLREWDFAKAWLACEISGNKTS